MRFLNLSGNHLLGPSHGAENGVKLRISTNWAISLSVDCSSQAERDRKHHSTALTLEGKRELNAEETDRMKRLLKKLVRTFQPDLHEQDPEKRKLERKIAGINAEEERAA